jgi:chemotaxis protein CheX
MSVEVNDVVLFTQEIWSLVLGQTATPTDGRPAGDDDPFTSCVHITGAWRGAVMLTLPSAVAARATATMFSIDAAAVTPTHLYDAIGELVNMIGGNLKALFKPPCYLSLPMITTGRDVEMNVVGGRCLAEVAFETADGTFSVTIVERADEGRARLTCNATGVASPRVVSAVS